MKIKTLEDIILFENDDYILINKPPHFSTLDDRTSEGKISILSLSKEYHSEAQIVHRLDKETSGVLAIAKNPEAYRHLSIQFEKRKVEKTYHAFVGGTHSFENQLVDASIYVYNTGVVSIDKDLGKKAQTYFDTIKIYKAHSLIACKPITGRMHQIRIHLALLKAPIIQDTQYGGKSLFLSEIKKNFNLKKDAIEQALIQRVALHAYSLTFKLLNEDALTTHAPYPKDIRALQNQLEKHSLV